MPRNKLPRAISLSGEDYRATVALIHTKDAHGRPKLVTLVHDEESIDLAGGEEFLVTYVSAKMLRKKK